jgi:hypothetical protein
VYLINGNKKTLLYTGDPGSRCGWSITQGDFHPDSGLEAAIGCPDFNNGNGIVHVVNLASHDVLINLGSSLNRGTGISVFNFSQPGADSLDALLIGSPFSGVGAFPNAGAMDLADFSDNIVTRLTQNSPGVGDKSEPEDRFGYTVPKTTWNSKEGSGGFVPIP